MDDLVGRAQSALNRLRGHSFFRAVVVWGSAAFFILQALDLFGFPSSVIRVTALVLIVGFLAGEGFYLWQSRMPAVAVTGHGRLRRWLLGGRRWVRAAFVLLVLGAGAWVLGRRLIRSPVRAGTDVMAVMPFVASGEDVQDLSIGMVSLLTANLDQVGGIRMIDPGTVLYGWSQRAAGGTLDLQGALRIGRDLGAGAILWGSVAAVREAVQVSGEIYTVDGERVAQRQERGDVDDLHAVIDRLSVQLLRDIWRSNAPVPDLRIGAITTESPEALRAFVHGERHFRAGRYDSAVVVFENATRLDTTFALAHFRLSEAYGWSTHFGSESAVGAAEAAARFAARLPERERSLAVAQMLFEKGDFAALDTARSLTRRYPDDALAWYQLGEALYHASPMLEPPPDELIEPFRRAVALDPTPSGGMIHVLELALSQGDRALFDEFLAHYRAAAGPDMTDRWEQLARVRWAPADSLVTRYREAANRFFEERPPITYIGRLNLVLGKRFATEMQLDPADLPAVVEDMTEQASTLDPGIHAQFRMLPVFALADMGRVREASALLDTLAAIPDTGPFMPPPPVMRIFWGVAGLYPADSLPAQLALLAQDSTSMYAPMLVRLSHLARGDPDAADTVSRPPSPPETADGPDFGVAFPMALDALELLVRGDTTAAITLMHDAIHEAGFGVSSTQTFHAVTFNYAVALSGQPETRAEGIRRLRSYLFLGGGPAAPAWLALAEALEAEGELARAAEAWAHVIRIWEDADPHLQPQVLRARQNLQRLTREPVNRAPEPRSEPPLAPSWIEGGITEIRGPATTATLVASSRGTVRVGGSPGL